MRLKTTPVVPASQTRLIFDQQIFELPFILVLAAVLCCSGVAAKTINAPPTDIVEVIGIARDYLKAHNIDLSHRFLAGVEYKNLHSEYERPYWLLTWALSAGTSEGQLYVRSSTPRNHRPHATIRVFVHPGSNPADAANGWPVCFLPFSYDFNLNRSAKRDVASHTLIYCSLGQLG